MRALIDRVDKDLIRGMLLIAVYSTSTCWQGVWSSWASEKEECSFETETIQKMKTSNQIMPMITNHPKLLKLLEIDSAKTSKFID